MNSKKIITWLATGLHLLGVPLTLFIARAVLAFFKTGSYELSDFPLDLAFSALAYDFTAMGLSIRKPGVPVIAGSSRMPDSQPSMFYFLTVVHFTCLLFTLVPFANTSVANSVWYVPVLVMIAPFVTWGSLLGVTYTLWKEQRTNDNI